MTIIQAIVKAAQSIRKQFEELNTFKTEIVRLEGFDIRTAILSTRVYIVLLTITLIILTGFTVFDGQNQDLTVQNPSQLTFINLNRQYPSTISCPCQKITIPYGEFVSISVNYHPICSSKFISDSWINLLFNSNISYYYPLDFRSSASGNFQLLSSLCRLTENAVSDAIDNFLADTLLTQYVLSENLFDTTIETQSVFLKTSTSNSFQQTLQLIRSTTFSNQLQTALQTSILEAYYQYTDALAATVTYETSFSTTNGTICRCGSDIDCSSALSGFFNISRENTRGVYVSYDSLIANVTGFVVGCYGIESLLTSTLECLFTRSCLNGILSFFPTTYLTADDHLNSNETQFSTKTTVDILISNLFIESWITLKSFDNYFEQCSPIFCTFTFTQHTNFLHTLIKLLGLYGGLTIALRLCIPRAILWWCRRKRTDNTRNRVYLSLFERYGLIRQWIQIQIVELNLFDTQTARNDPYELTTSKIITRLYLIFTFISVIILTFYTAANVRTQTIIVSDPSENVFTELYSKYSTTLECSCTRIAIYYDNFMSLSPRYHPVCSSLFVSSEWINSISTLNWPDDFFDPRDFRVAGQVSFSSLKVLCSFTELTVSNAWYSFKQSSFISDRLLSNQELLVRLGTALAYFESSTLVELKQALAIIQFQTATLLAMGSQNYAFDFSEMNDSIEFQTTPQNWSSCSCVISDTCRYQIGFYNLSQYTAWSWNPSMFDIPQFFGGCFIIQSILQSSLECFFNQTCLDRIQFEIRSNNSINITILEANATKFPPETSIGELIDVLMIEGWGESTNYSQYYEQCAVKQCSYTITSRNSFSYVFIVLLGLCGGIVTALKIIIPLIVRQLRDTCRPTVRVIDPTVQTPFTARMRTILELIKVKILEFNLFETELSWNDAQLRRQEIISTRIHSLLLTISVVVLIIYTSASIETQTITIKSPSQLEFDQLSLSADYFSTLQCPCQNITIPYQSFTSISYQFHQLCSSDFIDANSNWTNLLYSTMMNQNYLYDDFRSFALPHFRLLASLCRLANDTMADALERFGLNVLITDRAQIRQTIETEATNAIEQFRLSTIRTFLRTLDLTRSISQGNGIVSGTLSNWYFVATDFTNFATVWTKPRSYDDQNNCSCGTNATCTSQAKINNLLVPGFRVGCYAVDSLLQSNLECLYELSCIDSIKIMLNSSNFTVDPLDAMISSPNVTVQSLVNALFIDQWETNIVYQQYYATCAPLFCSYSLNQRASPVYIVTAIISLYGGLSTALKLVAPILTQIGQYFIRQYRHVFERRIHAELPINERL